MDIRNDVEHSFAQNGDVTLHTVSLGEGPLVVMIHGFPDFWYSWRYQMAALKDNFQVVAYDQRGYNKSGQPIGVEAYDLSHLVEDVAAVIRHYGHEKATIVGHDWGGMVAWHFGLQRPEMTDKLIILNLPHPNGLYRELATNPVQQAYSEYAYRFQEKMASDPELIGGGPMTAEALASWVQDDAAKPLYVEALERSYFDGMLNYYKQNFPPASRFKRGFAAEEYFPPLTMPVLQFHGLADQALHADGLNHTWEWVNMDLTLVTVPDVGHFVQHGAADLVSNTMKWWLMMRSC